MIHGTIVKNGFAKDSVIQSSLLSLYGEMGCLSYAKKMFDEMTVRDLVSWSSIILSYVENGKSNEGLGMFRLMVLEGFRPDSVTMLSVAEACGVLGFLILARLIHGYIVRRNIETDGSMTTSLVAMYSKCGGIAGAERIFLNVKNCSTSLWTAIISSYYRNCRFVEALRSFVSMLNSRVEPNSVTMMSVLGSFAGLGCLREGKSVHCFIIRKEMDLDYDALGPVFIELYMKCGTYEKHASSRRHAGEEYSQCPAHRVDQHLYRMHILCSERIRNDQQMMWNMNVSVQELVPVQVPVHEKNAHVSINAIAIITCLAKTSKVNVSLETPRPVVLL
ncbi:hypothetical protein F3Y22_tig00110429pilonHSYRG00873 [Hibiscus syriacus]|uniref:Pentatricopeptide repeat-containing protein n=1 Tax=Hibiscus syriacus TaxID=106335 RepID=A0A6A3AQ68_HIBSY|nr:hypothetical protein F3Y22_tig00110429pilonHSYRG00873 [Hibiscus syriacus]